MLALNLVQVVALESTLRISMPIGFEAIGPKSTIDSSVSKQTSAVEVQQSDFGYRRLSFASEVLVAASLGIVGSSALVAGPWVFVGTS